VIELPAACCGNCVAWKEVQANQGECRFGPPTPLFMGFRSPALTGQPPQPIIGAAFPGTQREHVCRQWQLNPGIDDKLARGEMLSPEALAEIDKAAVAFREPRDHTAAKGANDA
jgi:hypothetical protein